MNEDKRSLNIKKDYQSAKGAYENDKDPTFGYSPTDVYYDTEKKLANSKVAIPTYDAVIEAKEWVDDINKK